MEIKKLLAFTYITQSLDNIVYIKDDSYVIRFEYVGRYEGLFRISGLLQLNALEIRTMNTVKLLNIPKNI